MTNALRLGITEGCKYKTSGGGLTLAEWERQDYFGGQEREIRRRRLPRTRKVAQCPAFRAGLPTRLEGLFSLAASPAPISTVRAFSPFRIKSPWRCSCGRGRPDAKRRAMEAIPSRHAVSPHGSAVRLSPKSQRVAPLGSCITAHRTSDGAVAHFAIFVCFSRYNPSVVYSPRSGGGSLCPHHRQYSPRRAPPASQCRGENSRDARRSLRPDLPSAHMPFVVSALTLREV